MNHRAPAARWQQATRIAAVAGIALAVLFPAWAEALREVAGEYGPPCGGFTDVGDNNRFCGSLEWVRNRGITYGCGQGQYCPTDYVTREQMAAFLSRMDKVLVPTLIDATGIAIGAYARQSSPLEETVFYRAGGHVFALPLVAHPAGAGFYEFDTGTVHFELPNCTGQAILDTTGAHRVVGRRFYRVVEGPDASALLFASVPEAALTSYPVSSYLYRGACSQAYTRTVLGRAAFLVEDLDLRFERPFQLK